MRGESNAKTKECFGIILFVITLLIFLSLISYTPSDNSWNHLSHKQGSENIIGNIGADTSDLLYQLFGFAAFLLLIPLTIMSWKLLFGHEMKSKWLKGGGFLLLLLGGAAILQIFADPLPGTMDTAGSVSSTGMGELPSFMPGGAAGVLITDVLLKYLNRTGSIIILLAVLLLGGLIATPWSLAQGFSRLSGTIPNPPRQSWRERFQLWLEKRKNRRTIVSIRPTPASTPAPVFAPVAPQRPGTMPFSPTPVVTERQQTSVVHHDSGEKNRATQSARPAEPQTSQQEREPHDFELPSTTLLKQGASAQPVDEAELREKAQIITDKCAEFGAGGNVTQIHPGPVVTTFEFKPDPGVRYSRITGLNDDLCLGIKAESLRIDRLPGKATIGMEVPNTRRETIMLRDLLESEEFTNSRSKLTMALGKQINGDAYVTDLAKMPHLLIAGATGAGKSVALNCMITSILYKATPEEVRFIFIDPKMVELGIYTDIPHLLTPIVTDPGEAANALRWAVNEMEVRYKKLARRGVRNIEQYNTLLRGGASNRELAEGEEPEQPLPLLVLIIDELADLMLVSSKEVEASISRLAAKARAVGVHLILATQRPSVDVITGVIKANLPSRIAFKVASKVDSRTIIDGNGAEHLLGNGDMLFIPPGTARLIRIHGAYVSEKETQDIVNHLKAQGRPTYDNSVRHYAGADEGGNRAEGGRDEADAQEDSLYGDAVRVVITDGRASTSLLQRRLSIGYGRAAKLMDTMFQNGIIGPADGARPREVLVGPEFLERQEEMNA